MELEIRLARSPRTVSLERTDGEPESYRFEDRTTGDSRRITVVRREPTRLLLSVNDKLYSVRPVSRTAEGVSFLLNGNLIVAQRSGRRGKEPAGAEIASVDRVVVSHFPA